MSMRLTKQVEGRLPAQSLTYVAGDYVTKHDANLRTCTGTHTHTRYIQR